MRLRLALALAMLFTLACDDPHAGYVRTVEETLQRDRFRATTLNGHPVTCFRGIGHGQFSCVRDD